MLTQGLNGPECGISTCFFSAGLETKVQETTALREEVDVLLGEEEVVHYSDSGAREVSVEEEECQGLGTSGLSCR